jgi:hypothetical protein
MFLKYLFVMKNKIILLSLLVTIIFVYFLFSTQQQNSNTTTFSTSLFQEFTYTTFTFFTTQKTTTLTTSAQKSLYDVILQVKKGIWFEVRFYYYYYGVDTKKCELDSSQIVSYTLVKVERLSFYDYYYYKVNIPPSGKLWDDAYMEIITNAERVEDIMHTKLPYCRVGNKWVFIISVNYYYPRTYSID